LFLLCFSRTEMFGAMCSEATFKNIFISLYMFEMFKSFRVSLCWDKWVLQGSQETMCRSGSFTDREKCWGFSLLSALWSGLFCDYQFDITTMREAAVCLCDISLESSRSEFFLEASNYSLWRAKKRGLMVFLFEKKEEPLQDVPSAVLTGSR
jgi:hypothetical protein